METETPRSQVHMVDRQDEVQWKHRGEDNQLCRWDHRALETDVPDMPGSLLSRHVHYSNIQEKYLSTSST